MTRRASTPLAFKVILVTLGLIVGLNLVPGPTLAGATTPVAFVQGAAASNGSAQTSETLTLNQAVGGGDLLVGWFAQFSAAGPVTVSDSVNGNWTRSVSQPFSGGGDIALYFVPNAAAAPAGLTITVGASGPTFLQASAAEYSGLASVNPLDQAITGHGVGTAVAAGPTNAVPAGELVFSALTTGGSPASVTPGSSNGRAFTPEAHTIGDSAYEQDITSSSAGAQTGTATLGAATDWYAVTATFASVVVPVTVPTYQQGSAFAAGSTATSQTTALSQPVHAGDLLVGWFAQFNVPGQVTVSDNVNGAWTRAGGSLSFVNGAGGDIALYYLANAQSSPSGVTVTVASPTAAFLQGAAADYSGVASVAPLDQLASAEAVSTAVNTGMTAPVGVGDLLYSAVLTGGNPVSTAPGSSAGLPFTARAQTATGSAYEQDILQAAAGPQAGTATLGASTDWYAVAVAFRPTAVVPAKSTTTVSLPPGPAVVGQPFRVGVNVAATVPVGGPTPTGSVTVGDGRGQTCVAPLDSSGNGSCNLVDAAPGPYTITGSYGGDPAYIGSTGMANETVNPAVTVTTLTSAPNPSTFGAPVTFVATVAVASPGAGTPTGSVVFSDGSAVLGSGTLANSSGQQQASLTTSALTGGTRHITAAYQASTNFAGSTSAALTQQVNPAATTLKDQPAHIQLLALRFTGTATLTRSDTKAPLAGQTVTFSTDGAFLCSGVTNAQGTATCSGGLGSLLNSLLEFGDTATFAGTASYGPSSGSGGLVVTAF